jgi:hypothetical protein
MMRFPFDRSFRVLWPVGKLLVTVGPGKSLGHGSVLQVKSIFLFLD